MKLHLVDATFELFRAYYSRPPRRAPDGRPVNAVQGIVDSMLSLLREPDVTHIGAATDYVIESWRNDLFPGYKSSAGMDPDLLAQFRDAERALEALGMAVWPMVADEADDGIAAAIEQFGGDPRIEQIVICSVDKDLGQLVASDRIVLRDRMRQITYDEAGIIEKFGVEPGSIPDYLALVGDSSDGFPGLPGWGAKSASAVLAKLEAPRGHPGIGARLGGAAAKRLTAGGDARPAAGRCAPLSAPGDPEPGRRHLSHADPRLARMARRSPRRVRGAVRRARLRHGPRTGPPLGRLRITPIVYRGYTIGLTGT